MNKRMQRGIATILMIVMVGLALSATTLGSMYYLRSSQEQGMSMHAQTMAQARAWSAASILYEYLKEVARTEGEWPLLKTFIEEQSLPLSISVDLPDVTASITGLRSTADQVLLTARINAVAAEGSRAQSASTIEVVYAIAQQTEAPTPTPNNSVITFYDRLQVTGGIDVFSAPGSEFEINVMGDVNIGNTSISGINIIRSTGSIDFSGGSSRFDELHASCDIRLNGAGSAALMRTTNNICISGSQARPGNEIRANNSVKLSSAEYGDVFAMANRDDVASCSASAARVCSKDGMSISGVELTGGVAVNNVLSKGDVSFPNSPGARSVQAEGNLNVTWSANIREPSVIGGSYTAPPNYNVFPASRVSIIPGHRVNISPVQPVTIEREHFDANTLRTSANYLFYMDGNRMRVIVRDMIGLADGDYYLHHGSLSNRPYNDYLCTKPPGQAVASDCLTKLGYGYSDYNALISYSNGEWRLTGDSMAPGVAFFVGNLNLDVGKYTNTFIATGNIRAGGDLLVTALNYAGRPGVCANNKYLIRPERFCGNGAFDYSAYNGIGNYALLAGSCTAGNCQNYVGGDITSGARSDIRGAVKAGNEFISGGNSTIRGFITALALRGSTNHTLNQRTVIDLRELPPGYDPTGGGSTPGGGSEEGQVTAGEVVMRWARYL